MRRYPKEVKKFIAENVRGITTRDLAELVNAKFGTDFTESKMKAYKSNHQLKSGRCGVPAGRPSKVYPAEVKEFIEKNHKGVGPKEMMIKLNEKFNASYTHSQISTYYTNHKLSSGITGQFKKGNRPWNKGKKGINYEGCKATQFKPGRVPHTWVPIGSERVTRDGYLQIKVQDGKKQKNWRGKHILAWEAVNGPLPPGHAILFGDSNKRNFDLDNLILVSRAQLVRMNQKGLIKNDIELTKTGILIADIHNKMGERKRKKGSKLDEKL